MDNRPDATGRANFFFLFRTVTLERSNCPINREVPVSSRCKCCGRRFSQRPQNPDQKYCSRKPCQNARRQRWRRAKRSCDADYRANQYDSQRRWLEKHPEYWRNYRAQHPEYEARNRRLQKDRDRLRRNLVTVTRTEAILAKSDACSDKSDEIPVYYELLRAQPDDLAKRYASRLIFRLIPVSYDDIGTEVSSCKETTRGTLQRVSDTTAACPRPSP